jgi:hypothetical protein
MATERCSRSADPPARGLHEIRTVPGPMPRSSRIIALPLKGRPRTSPVDQVADNLLGFGRRGEAGSQELDRPLV